MQKRAPIGKESVALSAKKERETGERNLPKPAPPEEKNKTPTKTSMGIILCRVNETTRRVEVGLVNKRYTYAFADFAHGRYFSHNVRGLSRLFGEMTADELLDIWSLDFSRIWFRVWLDAEKKDMYNKKFAKFQASFIKGDGGTFLRGLIKQTAHVLSSLWEIPKGKKNSTRESDILCAIRELNEETDVNKSLYRILPGVKKSVTFTHMGVKYVQIFYAALAHPWLAGKDLNSVRAMNLVSRPEVREARWMDIEQVRLIDVDKRLENLLQPIFRLVKKFARGKFCPILETIPTPQVRKK